jgi:hypothetical protein
MRIHFFLLNPTESHHYRVTRFFWPYVEFSSSSSSTFISNISLTSLCTRTLSVLACYRLLSYGKHLKEGIELNYYNSMMQAEVVRLRLMRISANVFAFITKMLKLSGPSNLNFMTFAPMILTSFVFPRHGSTTWVTITVCFLTDTQFNDLTGCTLWCWCFNIHSHQLGLLQAQLWFWTLLWMCLGWDSHCWWLNMLIGYYLHFPWHPTGNHYWLHRLLENTGHQQYSRHFIRGLQCSWF